MKKLLTLLSVLTLNALWEPVFTMAQETHVIEPAILEVRYDSWQETYDDSYILRVGKTANQFFSFYRYRSDSLMNTNEATMQIAVEEFFQSVKKDADKSQKGKHSTIGREWLYQDTETGKLSLYSNYASAYNTYEEDIPTQEWAINTDSVIVILGMECHFATTSFRGRVWNVWFTEEIPVSLGPWKLGGLPGLILSAVADDDFIKFTAVSVKTEGINPVTFYNWGNEKYYKMDREKFLRYKNRPRTVPNTNKVLPAEPDIELE